MTRTQVVTDSSCDLSPAEVSALDIAQVPLMVTVGGVEYEDGIGLSAADFWQRWSSSGPPPGTAAPSPARFAQAFLGALDGGYREVLCLTLSAKLSATFQSATLAAAEVADRIPVRVIDSVSVSMGLGIQVRRAAQLCQEGHHLDEVVEVVTQLQRHQVIRFTLPSLESLRRGGRIGRASALLGSLLSIQPLLGLSAGEVVPVGRQRSRQRAFQEMVSLVAPAPGELEHLSVVHGNAPDVHMLVELLRGAGTPSPEVTLLGPTVGCHVGPGTVGLVAVGRSGPPAS